MNNTVPDTSPPRRGLWPGDIWIGNVLIMVLAILSPAAVFVAIRIGLIRTCTGIDLLQLPWHPLLSTAVMILAILIALASLTMIVLGFGTRGMRGGATAAVVFGLVSVIPVALALFLSVYGDPGPVCNPV